MTVALAGLSLLVLWAGYGLAFILGARALQGSLVRQRLFTLLTMPAYWLLASAAAWYALWQFAVAPFHWNKTAHGLRRRQAGSRDSRKQPQAVVKTA
jgi:hypothetical protein